jgi:tetratricopeptide (TPR) repeat protein
MLDDMLQREPPVFHGRKEPLEQIIGKAVDMLHTQYSQVILIEGPGGIGKTMLLNECARQLMKRIKEEKYPLKCVGPLDMDDTEYRVIENLQEKIREAVEIRQKETAVYPEIISATGDARAGRIEAYRSAQRNTLNFNEAYTRVTEKFRVVIFIDTLETVRDTFTWNSLLLLLKKLSHTLFVLAGRQPLLDQKNKFTNMPFIPPNGVTSIRLLGWPKAEARDFVKQQTNSLLPEWQIENLLHLSRCRPLHLTLAIQFLRWGKIDLLELENKEIQNKLPLYSKDKDENQQPNILLENLKPVGKALFYDFERKILSQYSGPDSLAETIRRMAHVRRRLNQEMYEDLTRVEPSIEAPAAWEALLNQPWVRRRAGEFVTLHDIVSEMINKHIWGLRDPRGLFRRSLSEQAVSIIGRQIKRFENQLRKLEEKSRNNTPLFWKITHTIWILEAEQLFYQLDADLEKGYRNFIKKFDNPPPQNRASIQEMLLAEIDEYTVKFPVEDARYYEVKLRAIRAAMEKDDAETIQKTIKQLKKYYTAPEQQYQLLRLTGNLNLRSLGRPGQALRYFRKTHKMTQTHDSLEDKTGESLMEIGWASRHLGRWSDSAKSYEKALMQTDPMDPTKRQLISQIENNLAYVKALIGEHDIGEMLIENSLNYRREQNNPDMVGIALSTQGEVFRYQKKFFRASASYYEALEIFKETQNFAWLGQVHQQLAISLVQEDAEQNLKEAIHNIEESLYLCQEYNLRAVPSALNRAGRIYALAGEYFKAIDFFQRGITAAKSSGDYWFLAANFVERAELLYQRAESQAAIFDPRRIYLDQELIERMEKSTDYTFQDLFGRWHLVQGHLAWRKGIKTGDRSHWRKALEKYKTGFALIAEGYFGSHGLSAIPAERDRLKAHILALPKEEGFHWCKELYTCWKGLKKNSTVKLTLLSVFSNIYYELLTKEKDGPIS